MADVERESKTTRGHFRYLNNVIYCVHKKIAQMSTYFMLQFSADDMGLGKTLSMISLVLKAYEAQKDQEEDSEMDDSFEDSNLNCIHL